MSLKAKAVKNVTATWLGLAVHAVVGFVLSPFILHRLGDEAFSVWILIFAFTGYFGLLDLGIRSALVKYTAKWTATGDHDELSNYLSTSLAFYSAMGGVVILLTAGAYAWLPHLFKISAQLLPAARILLLLSGAAVALTFPLGVFAGALEGLQKFSWLQLSQIGTTLLRAVLIVVALSRGGGLLAVGTITIAMSLTGYLIFTVLALRVLPVRLSFRRVEGAVFRKMSAYGVFAFAILAAERLRFQSDAMVIGAFLSSTAITLFSIASRLVEYSSYAVRSMSQIFAPMSSEFHAKGDLPRLKRMFIAGNRASALIIFPICVTLLILGKPIIEAWVGAPYLGAYPVLALLIVPRTLYLAQSTSVRILLGMGRHNRLAAVLLLEGGMNVLLSLLLVQRNGIVGVAWGTAIPLACTGLFFLPRHLCNLLNIPMSQFLARAYRLPLALALFQALALYSVSELFPVHSFSGLVLETALGIGVYASGIALTAWRNGASSPRSWQALTQLLEPK